MRTPAFHHVDLVVMDLLASLSFYRQLLGPLGWRETETIRGERGETVHYLLGETPRSASARSSR